MIKYSVKKLCEIYPKQYILVSDAIKASDGIITSCSLVRVYKDLDACKQDLDVIMGYLSSSWGSYDMIYGDYDDYFNTRCTALIAKSPDMLTQAEVDELLILMGK